MNCKYHSRGCIKTHYYRNIKIMISYYYRWYDGFSTFYVGGNGKIYKHVADKVMPDQDMLQKEKDLRITAKLAMFVGLIDIFNR